MFYHLNYKSLNLSILRLLPMKFYLFTFVKISNFYGKKKTTLVFFQVPDLALSLKSDLF